MADNHPWISDHLYEDLLRDGITAAKTGDQKTAQWLLRQAAAMRPMDAQPYVWLSAATDDPTEQKDFLEEALAREPGNVAARRGLVALSGKLDPAKTLAQGAGLAAQPPAEPAQAQAQSFKCPRCGGNMTAAPASGLLTCDYCDYSQPLAIARPAAQPGADHALALDMFLPTTLGHQWAKTLHLLSCSDCGAVSSLVTGLAATQCPYCGSNQLVKAPEMAELIDPQAILPMQLDEKQAVQHVKEWLKSGFFTPDNLLAGSQGLRLRPAYYSAWVFDGTIEYKWSCEIYEGNGRTKRWVPISGSNIQFFDHVLVSGVKSLTAAELASVKPFDLKNLLDFNQDYLAGWPTIFYDRSLADALLLGREEVMRGIHTKAHSLIEAGRSKRNLSIGGGSWNGQTFKHILLPLWIGGYQYEGKPYHVLVNGNSGKVGGYKPQDKVKLIFAILIGALLLILLLLGLYTLLIKPG